MREKEQSTDCVWRLFHLSLKRRESEAGIRSQRGSNGLAAQCQVQPHIEHVNMHRGIDRLYTARSPVVVPSSGLSCASSYPNPLALSLVPNLTKAGPGLCTITFAEPGTGVPPGVASRGVFVPDPGICMIPVPRGTAGGNLDTLFPPSTKLLLPLIRVIVRARWKLLATGIVMP